MVRYFGLFCLAGILFLGASCASGYWLQKNEETIAAQDSLFYRAIPVSDSILAATPWLDTIYVFLKRNDLKKLDKKFKAVEKTGDTPDDLLISRSIFYMIKGKYDKASICLSQSRKVIHPLTELLQIDLEYELAMKKKKRIDYDAFLKRYQMLVDSSPGNTALRKAILIRLRYIRYIR